jgi:phosphoribosylformylglycinamidine synthase
VSVLASAGFGEGADDAAKRPSVQVGDPFEEKRLIEACLELLEAGLAVGVQDLGGAGLTCATSETASKGGAGMDVFVSRVHQREPGMEAFEVMTSESQERMLAIVQPEDLDEVLAVARRWEVEASVVGRVTGSGRLRILDHAPEDLADGAAPEVLADVPARSLEEDAPKYRRPLAPPTDLEARRANGADRLPASADPGADLLEMLTDTSWVWSQYDHQLYLNTVVAPGADAAVLRLKHPVTGEDTGRGLALSSDGNHRWCALDPRAGAAATVVESVLNLAAVGARPVALVNCLNFGNPEHPEVMWQLSEAIDGISEACLAFDVPVVGGNVSLYNESRGRDIDPTPIVATLGLIDELVRRPPLPALVEGHRIIQVGDGPVSLSGSEWARRRGHADGALAPLDLHAARKVADVVRGLVSDGVPSGVHDVSSGGVGLALAEMAVSSGVGFTVARIADHGALFGESAGRVLLSVAPEDSPAVLERCEAAGVPTLRLGVAAGDRLVVKDLLDVALDDAVHQWRSRLPEALGSGSVH